MSIQLYSGSTLDDPSKKSCDGDKTPGDLSEDKQSESHTDEKLEPQKKKNKA